jgi:purine nucleoside phosphorylase
MYRAMADVIGMSTVHEAQCAVGLGMKVAAVSVVSNTLEESPSKKLTHEDVLRVAANSADRLQQVLQLVVDTVEHIVEYKEE